MLLKFRGQSTDMFVHFSFIWQVFLDPVYITLSLLFAHTGLRSWLLCFLLLSLCAIKRQEQIYLPPKNKSGIWFWAWCAQAPNQHMFEILSRQLTRTLGDWLSQAALHSVRTVSFGRRLSTQNLKVNDYICIRIRYLFFSFWLTSGKVSILHKGALLFIVF